MSETAKRATRWTDTKVAALKLPAGTSEQRTLVAPGLYLHARGKTDGSVSKHWQYRAQVNGARRWLSLGAYPEVSLGKATAELQQHHAAHELAKKGEADHPVVAARFARRAAKGEPTVSEAFDLWVADKRLGSRRKGGAPVRDRTVTVLTENFNADVRDRIGDAKIAKLTPEAVQSCIDAPRKRGAPGSAGHVYRTLRGLVTFAIKRDLITGADPMRGIENPRPYRPAPVNAATDADIVALFKVLDDSTRLWPCTKLAVEFQLATGARPGEVRECLWDEIDEARAQWVIPADRVKTGRAFTVHLSVYATGIVTQAKALRTDDGEHVFPGARGGALEKMAVARALARLTERLHERGGKHLAPHDLRRTFRTMLSRIGVAPHVAELCLNHLEKETLRRVYDGHDYSAETRDAWDRAGKHLQGLRAGGAVVVPTLGRAVRTQPKRKASTEPATL